MSNIGNDFYLQERPLFVPPTYECLVCGRLANPKANIIDGGKAWLCPECKTKLRKLMEVSENA